ncbi:helix-turn-helix domain-containing protein [Dyadobacter linearis]|uniref:helix-turn-helix domain-containing protein n=1 Tax=Dyadobacter linearis TaxID=2823330 RepID=UPI001BFC5A9C|nr:helix-turn-helix domain-containing protein [Dyadobacter sp. CECT 9623]
MNFKLRLVKAYLNGGSYTGLAKVGGITRSLLKKWVGHYRQQGIEGLLPPGEQSYTREYKQEVVLVYQSSGLSLGECCFKYRIPSPSTLAGWIRQYEQFGIDGFSTARGRPRSMKSKPKIIKRYGPLTRLEELENENLRLRAENDLLKKLDALIREKEVAQKKKR